MPCEIIWLPGAARDLARLRGFIGEKNSVAAERAANQIKQAVQVLRENPKIGRLVENTSLFRELVIPFGRRGYVLRYQEQEGRVIIVRVRHGREAEFPQ